MRGRRLLIFAAVLLAMGAGGAGLIRFAGGGATEFRLSGSEMFIRGPITGASSDRFERLLEEADGLQVVVLGDIPGANDTGWLIQMSQFIRNAGLATRVEGDLTNDAILLFLAGVERSHGEGLLTIAGPDVARREGWPFDASPAGQTERHRFASDMVGDGAFADFMRDRLALGGTHTLDLDEMRRFGLVTGN